MKNNYKQYFNNSAKALLVMMISFLSFVASGQSVTVEGSIVINSVDPVAGPYYPFDEVDLDYTASDFPSGTNYYVIYDVNGNGWYDEEDHLLGSSTTADDELTITLPNDDDLDVGDILVIAGNDGDPGDADDNITDDPAYGSFTDVIGETAGTFPMTFDAFGGISVRSFSYTYDFSDDHDSDNLTSVLEIGLDSVTSITDNPIVVEYSIDGGTSYTALSDIYEDDDFDGADQLIVELPSSLTSLEVEFRVSQPGSDTFAIANDKAWTISDFLIRRTEGSLITYANQADATIDVSSPIISIDYSDNVTGEYVGEDFSLDFQALGFDDDATFYLFTGTSAGTDVLDSTKRVIYDQVLASALDSNDSATFEAEWPLEDTGDFLKNLRVAAVYGNIEEVSIESTSETVTILGSDENDFSYTFDQNSTRSIRTNSVDLSDESYVTLVVDFGFVSGGSLGDDNELLVEYSTNGGAWTVLEELDDENISNVTFEYMLADGALSSATQFRVRQRTFSFSPATDASWTLDALSINQYVEQTEVAYLTPTINNYQVVIDSVLDADDNVILNLGGTENAALDAGDEITVHGHVEGFDPDGESYAVIVGREYLLTGVSLNVGADSTITITGSVPADIAYDAGLDLELIKYEGTSALLGISESLFDYRQDEFEWQGGEYNSTNISFFESGDRWVTTPEFEIASNDDLTVGFTLKRNNSARSPSGTEIALEFSTDGSSFTEIDDFSINEAGTAGTTYEVSDLPSGVVSTSTQFRFRQKANNGEDLDAWTLSNVTVQGSTNLVEPGYIDYTDVITVDINTPVLTLSEPDNTDNLYPGTEVTIDFEITSGEFPADTEFTLYLDRGEFPINLGELTASGTFTIDVPAIVAGNYDLYVMSSYGEVESNTATLPVVNVEINNISIASDDALTDGSGEIVYPGSTLDIAYTIVGDIGSDVTATLEVYDHTDVDGEDIGWVTLESLQDADGTISTELPVGKDYDGDPEFRLSLVNGNLEMVEEIVNLTWNNDTNDYGNTTTAGSGYLFPTADRDGHQGNNYFYFGGTYTAVSRVLDFSEGDPKVDFDIEILNTYFSEPQWVYLQYSIDEGETWVSYDSTQAVEDAEDLFESKLLPEEAWTSETYLRFIANEDEQVSGTENILYLTGFSYELLKEEPISQVEFTFPSDLSLENLSLSISDLGEPDPEYLLGESFTVEYNADGPFPDDVSFAVILEGNDNATSNAYVLGESSNAGASSVEVSFASTIAELEELEDPFDDYEFNLTVVPYVKASETDQYRAAALQTDLTDEEDFIAIEGSDETTPMFTFNEKGNRSLLTKAYDLTSTDSVTLSFAFTYSGGTPSTLLTLPQLLVSTDEGASFDTLYVSEDDSDYSGEGYLFNSKTINVGIPDEFLTEATHFKWYQALNRGAGQNNWTVNSISIIEGRTNAYPTENFVYGVNQNQNVNAIVPDLDDYEWTVNDLTDPIFNGEDFEFLFTIDSTELEGSSFPEGTEFVFTLEGETDPETNEDVVIATTTEFGVGTASIPFYVENGNYDIYAYAQYTVVDSETGEEEVIILDEQDVATIDVFLRVVRTTFEFEENDVFYAGSSATFSIDIENNATNDASIDELYATLLAVDAVDGKDVILATQQGIADITVELPTFLNGNQTFVVELSENAPLGDVWDIDDFESDEAGGNVDNIITRDNFTSGDIGVIYTKTFTSADVVDDDARLYYYVTYDSESEVVFEYSVDGGAWVVDETETGGGDSGYSPYFDLQSGQTVQFRWRYTKNPEYQALKITDLQWWDGGTSWLPGLALDDTYLPEPTRDNVKFENENGRGLITTRDFTADELTNKTLFTFDLSFDEVSENLTSNQYLIFEYSLDMGANYSQLDTFPEVDSEFVINDSTVQYSLTDEMLQGVRFRFRQEERAGIAVSISDFNIRSGESLPFDYQSDDQDITKQQVLVTALNVEEICQGDEITAEYEIRGRFGDENMLSVNYLNVTGGGANLLDGYAFAATDGSGSVTFQLPTGILSEGDDNAFFRFSVDADDDTYADISEDFEVTGAYSENNVELVAPIDLDATFSVAVGDGSDIIECDPAGVVVTIDNPQNYFMYEIYNVEADTVMGSLTYDPEEDEDEIVLGSFSEALMLDMRITSMSSTGDLECNMRETTTSPVEVEYLESFKLFVTDGAGYELVEASDSLVICAGDNSGLTFDVFRDEDNADNPDMIEWFKGDLNNFVSNGNTISGTLEAGDYFARVTDGSCTYTTESFKIVEAEVPDAPEVTVVSGDLMSCDGTIEVELSAPDGFAYYLWSNGETTQTIVVDEADSYSVQVGNTFSCLSDDSEDVDVDAFDRVEFLVYNGDIDNVISGGETITGCGQTDFNTWDIENDGSTESAGTGTYVLYRDGTQSETFTGTSFSIDESGEYFVEWVSDVLNPNSCTTTSPTFTVDIVESVDERPVITADGPLAFCEGDTVMLSAPAGFAHYQWKRGGTVLQNNSETLDVTTSGNYTVEVSNVPFNANYSCGSDASVRVVVTVFSDLDLGMRVNGSNADNMEVFDVCDDNATLSLYNLPSGSYTVTWYMDDVVMTGLSSSSTSIDIQAGGTYYAEVSRSVANILDNSSTCVSATNPVVVNYYDIPEEVSIADPGATTFCEDEVDVTLTADAGAAFYQWYKDGSLIGSAITSNTLNVTEEGEYQVRAYAYKDGCASDYSNVITIEQTDAPNAVVSLNYEADCGGGVTFEVFSTSPEYSYQLVDSHTGESIGDSFVGVGTSSSLFLSVADISEEVEIDVEASYADGLSSCTDYYEYNYDVEPNSVVLEIEGVTLTAMIYGDNISGEIRWFRNDVEMVNKRGDDEIVVLDAATYSVEVEFYGGCVLTSNSIDLTSSTGRTSSAPSDGRIVASTYPNPSTEVVNIDIPGTNMGDYKVQIMTLSGQVVMSDVFNKDKDSFIKSINISSLDRGIYNMTVVKGKNVENIRIVKQ